MIKKHVVEWLGKFAVYFVGGPWVEICPPKNLSVGDEVEVSIVGFSRQSIQWMKWNDKTGESCFIQYDMNGNPNSN